MDEIGLILRIMIASAYYYGTTSMIEFNENHINEIAQKLNELFNKCGYKTDIFLIDKQIKTCKKFNTINLCRYYL